MAGKVFAYIAHKQGVADDSALELVSAAKKISADGGATAIVMGSNIGALSTEMAKSYKEVWKIENSALAYPNAEVIRKVLLNVLPKDAVVLVSNDTFGMDLSPGLSIKLDSPFLADVVDFEVSGNALKAVRQEYSGQAHTHVGCDIAAGAVINVRAGVFQPDESKSAGGQVNNY